MVSGSYRVSAILVSLLSRFGFEFFVRGFPACADIVLGLPSKQKHKTFVSFNFAVVAANVII